MPTFDHKKFFDAYKAAFPDKVRGKDVPAKLSQEQKDGLEFLLTEFEKVSSVWKDLRFIAYVLATVKHETANTFQPIEEYRANVNQTDVRRRQDRYWASGFYGRGYVQLTWKTNYKLTGRRLGVDLVGDPDLALRPDVAFRILTNGMLYGWFTGKKLTDYITDKKRDFIGARKIVNGTDDAELIAGYAEKFFTILSRSKVTMTVKEWTEGERPAEKPRKDAPAIVNGATAVREDAPATDGAATQVADAIVNVGDTGSAAVAVAEQSPPVAVPEPPPYNRVGFWATIKKDLAAAFGGNFSLQAISEYMQQAAGVPEWLIPIIKTLAVGGLVFTGGWFVFRIVHYLADGWKQRERTRLLAEAWTDPNRKDLQFVPPATPTATEGPKP